VFFIEAAGQLSPRLGRASSTADSGVEATRLPPGRVPRVARLMALALRLDELVHTGQVASYSANKPEPAVSRIGSFIPCARDTLPYPRSLLHPRWLRFSRPLRIPSHELCPDALTTASGLSPSQRTIVAPLHRSSQWPGFSHRLKRPPRSRRRRAPKSSPVSSPLKASRAVGMNASQATSPISSSISVRAKFITSSVNAAWISAQEKTASMVSSKLHRYSCRHRCPLVDDFARFLWTRRFRCCLSRPPG
jgi:hypothetical protein